MTGDVGAEQPGVVDCRAVVSFSADAETAADPAWRDHIMTTLSGLGEAAGLELVTVSLEIGPDSRNALKSINDLLSDPDGTLTSLAMKARNALLRENLRTARDVAAYGASRVDDIRNVSGKSVELIRDCLRRLGLEWEDRPTMETYVKLYEAPEHVPLSVAIDDFVGGVYSVGDLLSSSREQIIAALLKWSAGNDTPERNEWAAGRADSILGRTREFVGGFTAEQNRRNP